MNDDTVKALKCGARLRQVVTDMLEALAYVDVRDQTIDVALQKEQLRKAVVDIKRLLDENGLSERVYPLDPENDEQLRNACRRIFGIWISNEVLDRKGGT